ncbi:hypothetical protein AVEN_132411-1 [Araneus ventricosus]|uniref:YqaJ viral recombinase domain-containing protein n=1 Tax=Araneus ventricosus TaxID=182803 RepID=A0A4Y2WX03_ARAVE|nr:hypothetical protein AVEN_132411-1 [Araneus ventricosus]
MKYGQDNEDNAVRSLQESVNLKVRRCGLFVNPNIRYLAASPDGLIDDDGIVEVKCPASCKDLTPDEAIRMKKFPFWKLDKDGNTIVNKNHKYYFQVQGQLHITQKNYCLFSMWTEKGQKIEKIIRDQLFWQQKMEKKLEFFYFECLLPELVDPRFPRSMDIRNPPAIVEAQKKKIRMRL